MAIRPLRIVGLCERKRKMKTHMFPILILVAGCCVVSAQTERYVTVTAKPVEPSPRATNTCVITEGEAAEIVSMMPNSSYLTIEKDGISFDSYRQATENPGGRGTVIKGPATFRLLAQSSTASYLTLKVMPESFPPDRTLILPPGTDQVQITLESSTNLVQWSSATNGVYGSPDEARFFRIHLQKLN
jgi:hypothetical protein